MGYCCATRSNAQEQSYCCKMILATGTLLFIAALVVNSIAVRGGISAFSTGAANIGMMLPAALFFWKFTQAQLQKKAEKTKRKCLLTAQALFILTMLAVNALGMVGVKGFSPYTLGTTALSVGVPLFVAVAIANCVRDVRKRRAARPVHDYDDD